MHTLPANKAALIALVFIGVIYETHYRNSNLCLLLGLPLSVGNGVVIERKVVIIAPTQRYRERFVGISDILKGPFTLLANVLSPQTQVESYPKYPL